MSYLFVKENTHKKRRINKEKALIDDLNEILSVREMVIIINYYGICGISKKSIKELAVFYILSCSRTHQINSTAKCKMERNGIFLKHDIKEYVI